MATCPRFPVSCNVLFSRPWPRCPPPPTRDPHSPGYVQATDLPDGSVPSPDVDGNFVIGPTHTRAEGLPPHDDTPNGMVVEFTMSSADKFYPGIARTGD